ncbi:MAG: YfhO family protein [Clostridiales bacterium]|nr:YfhO family protein [Clostridiales bacterium]
MNLLTDLGARTRRRGTLFFCFAVPALAMTLLYAMIEVFPFGKNSVLVLDLNAQYIYYFEQFREIIRSGEAILYSFKRALGGEFMGIFAYYLSSPFSLITALFPKSMILEAMYVILVLKCGFTGLAFGYFIEEKFSFRQSVTVMFSVLYAFTSFAVVMQHNVMWTDNLIAFPLILCGLDALITRGRFRLYTLALAYAILSNFYIGYMACLFVLIWFFVRYFSLTPAERNPLDEPAHFVRSLARVGVFSLTAVAIGAVILLPTYYSLSFGKLEFSTPDWKPKQYFEFFDLLTKAFFGSYDTVRPEGMPFLYCGTLSLILSPLFFLARDIPLRRKIAFGGMMLFFFASFNLSTLDILWHGLQRPNWLNARFAYMFAALALWMAAEALARVRRIGPRAVLVSAAGWCALIVVASKIGMEHLPTFTSVWAGIGLLVLVSSLLCALIRALSGKNPGTLRAITIGLSSLVCLEAFAGGAAMIHALDEDVSFSNRHSYRQMIDTYAPAVEAIRRDDGFYRFEKLVHRKKNDNFALGIRGLSNSTSTLNARTVALLAQFGYASQSHWSMYAGATAVTDALFGVKYVMVDETDNKPVMNYIHDLYELYDATNTHIDIYENPYALSLAYAVDPATAAFPLSYDKEDDYTDPFTYMNRLLSAMTGEDCEVWRRAELVSTDTLGCDLIFATGHKGFEKSGSGGASVTFTVRPATSDALYCYFPARWPREASLMLNGSKIGTFFDGQNLSIRELGRFSPGEEVKVGLVLKRDELYIRSGVGCFWTFDEEAFIRAVGLLRDGRADLSADGDDHLFGTVTIPAGRELLFTSIPYDEGWRITVDGQEQKPVPILGESLIALPLSAGEHEIDFRYDPDCVRRGLAISTAGTAVFALCCVFENHLPIKRKKRTTT